MNMKKEISGLDRRHFLKASVCGAAMAGIAGAAGNFSSVFAQTPDNIPPSE